MPFQFSSSANPTAVQLKPTRQPMLWVVIAYALGILAGTHLFTPPTRSIIASLAFLSAAFYFLRRRRRVALFLDLAAFFLAGALHIQLAGSSAPADLTLQPFAYGPEIEVTAHVIHEGQIREASGEETQRLDIETEEIATRDGTRRLLRSGIRLSLYSQPGSEAHSNEMRIFHYGERLHVPLKLKLPRNFQNPGAFDYQGYLAANRISALASASVEEVHSLPGFDGSRIELCRNRIHSSVIAKVHDLWPAQQAALISAMVIGEDAFIDRDTRADFQRSGTYHVLVVSGMNVTILAFAVFWTLRRLRLSEIPATSVTILCCVAYAFLTEVGAPVWRATLMCAIFLSTRLLYRERAMVNALAATAFGLLIFDPRQLFSASFQMTFLCVLVVAAIALPLIERSSGFYRRALAHWSADDYSARLPPKAAQFRLDLRLIAGRISRFIGRASSFFIRDSTRFVLHAFELLLVSSIMEMGLALPMAYYFHRATTIGLPANTAVVPLTQLLMPTAILTICLGYISPAFGKVSAVVTSVALEGITGTVHGLGRLHIADFRVPTPSLIMIGFASAALIAAMLLARRRAALALLGVAALFASSSFLILRRSDPETHPGVLEVTSIDVGEGDSILLVSPQGRTLLVDAGGPTFATKSQLDFGEDVVAPYLWTRRISHLDAVAISHGHSDHIGGMAAILKDFRPKELWIGLLPPSRALDALIAQAHQLGVRVVRHWEGDKFDFGGTEVEVLFPPQDWPVGLEPKNNDSMVLHVSFGGTSVLLEGDAEKAVERRIAALHHPHADLLKVGHHGSSTSTTPEILESVKPVYAVISVGFHTSYGLPKAEVLARLQATGVHVYRTDLQGATTFYLDGRTVTPSLASYAP
jgi:competence protein ComEC